MIPDEQIGAIKAYITKNLENLAHFLLNHIDEFDYTDEVHEKACKSHTLRGYKEYLEVCSMLKGAYSRRMKDIDELIHIEVLERFCLNSKSDRFQTLISEPNHLKSYGAYLVSLLNLPVVDDKYFTIHGCKTVEGLASSVLDPIEVFLKNK